MIITKLHGGLGNQMFQYATARSLEANNKKNVLFDLYFPQSDSLPVEHYTVRNFELGIFKNLRASFMNHFFSRVILSKKTHYKIIRKLFNLNTFKIKQVENEFVNIPSHRNLYLDGYFQSEKYFKHIRSLLLDDFKFPTLDLSNNELINKMLSENSVSVHIRHGDYTQSETTKNYHGILPLDYYTKAIDLLMESDKNLSFYIFTDDKDFIKPNFSFLGNYHLVSGNTDQDSWKDMCLMQYCKHHIIANSSFSWWGAWLSQRDGLTIAPSEWFNSKKVKFDINDFVPNNWQIV